MQTLKLKINSRFLKKKEEENQIYEAFLCPVILKEAGLLYILM